jgi:hypothetical protein
MTRAEFLEGMDLLKKQWPTQFGQPRIEEMRRRVERIPDGAFIAACRDLVFEGGPCPGGSKIEQVVQEKIRSRASSKQSSPNSNIECTECSGSGAILAYNQSGKSRYCIAVACSCPIGHEAMTTGKLISQHAGQQRGYFIKEKIR